MANSLMWTKGTFAPVATKVAAVLSGEGIDPDRLAVCLDVLAQAGALPQDHPDAERVRMATAQLFKVVKQRRRRERRAEVSAADRAVIAATATGAPGRIDDE